MCVLFHGTHVIDHASTGARWLLRSPALLWSPHLEDITQLAQVAATSSLQDVESCRSRWPNQDDDVACLLWLMLRSPDTKASAATHVGILMRTAD
jgi:hypothetical protein